MIRVVGILLVLVETGRADAVNRFPVNVNNAAPVELLAAGFNFPQALMIAISRDNWGHFTGWSQLRDELKRHGLHDCGAYCLRAIDAAKDFVVFSGPTRMPVGDGVEIIRRARSEWADKRSNLGSALPALEKWLYNHRGAIGHVNPNDAGLPELLATGLSLLQAELLVALRDVPRSSFRRAADIEQKLTTLEKVAPCGAICKGLTERLRSSRMFHFGEVTTLIHPDPAREAADASGSLDRDVKKGSGATLHAIETFARFVDETRLKVPSLPRAVNVIR